MRPWAPTAADRAVEAYTSTGEECFILIPGRFPPKREKPQLTPSLRCRLVDEVVYWKVSFLSG